MAKTKLTIQFNKVNKHLQGRHGQEREEFVYFIEIGIGVFILAGLLALAIAWLTVSYQSIKAALANPVESLRYE